VSLWGHIRLRLSCEVCELGFPIFLNADHTHSLAKGVEAAKAGFDSIVFDLSALPFEENARRTKQAVEALKAINLSMLVGMVETRAAILPNRTCNNHRTGRFVARV
jgi:fructose/tagatose bisphosphate aldolase